MSTQQVLAVAPRASVKGPLQPSGHSHLRGSDFKWAIAFLAPYATVFLGLRRVSVRVCAMDGEQALALCRSNGGSIVCTERGQYSGFRWCRGERKDILGLAVVRLLHAPAVVDQSFVGCLCFALGYCDGTSLHLVSLDASRGPRLGR